MSEINKLGGEFENRLDDIIEYINDMPKNQLKRLVTAIVAHPIRDDMVKLVHDEELEAYNIGIEIQSIKLNMHLEKMHQDSLEAQKEENV